MLAIAPPNPHPKLPITEAVDENQTNGFDQERSGIYGNLPGPSRPRSHRHKRLTADFDYFDYSETFCC
jgi:hypothetical protein